jgi:hypothetical protein
VEAARLVVDVRHPQAFARRVVLGKAAGEELPRRGKSVEFQREFGTLIAHGRTLAQARNANDWNLIDFGVKSGS